MEVAFVRVPERQSEALVHLDGRVLVLPAPGNFRVAPPHDLGHFIVENTLGWQTGFWGYIARGVMFPSMYHKSGTRPPHGEERSRSAIRGAKDHLAEGESLAGAVAAIVCENNDGDPDRIRHVWKQAFWPSNATAPNMPIEEIQRACRAFRQVEADWRALALGDSLQFRWSFRANPLAPDNPLDQKATHRRRRAHR